MNAWKPSPIQIGFDLEKPYKFKSLFKSVQNASTTIIQNDAHFPPDQMNARLAFCVMGKFYVVKEGCASNHLLYYLSVGWLVLEHNLFSNVAIKQRSYLMITKFERDNRLTDLARHDLSE